MDLDMFFESDDDGAQVERQRPETTSESDVALVLEKHAGNQAKHYVIHRFVTMYLDGVQWDWYESHKAWLVQEADALSYAATLPDVTPDDDLNALTSSQYLEQFAANNPEPVRPPVISVAQYCETAIIKGHTIAETMFKAARAAAVSASTVVVGKAVFNADEMSQRRMLSAIVAAEQLQLTEADWTLADNTVIKVDIQTLKQAHAMAIAKQGSIWRR